MNNRFNMHRDLEIHVNLQNKIVAELRNMPRTPPHLQKGSCTWRLHDHSATYLAYAIVRFNELFSDDRHEKFSYMRDDGLIASMIDLISESVDMMRFTIDYVMGRATTGTTMGSPLNSFEIIGLQMGAYGNDAKSWEHQMCTYLLWCEGLVGKLGKLRSTLKHISLIETFYGDNAIQNQRKDDAKVIIMTSDEKALQKLREHFGV